MTTAKFDYGMNTDIGNNAIHSILLDALENKMHWSQVRDILVELSKKDGFEEATDTAVRERIYNKLF